MLDSLSEQGRRALLERSITKEYATGQTLWSSGDAPIGLVLVLEGKVRIIRTNDARQTVIHSGEPGATLGEIPFFTRSPYPATAVAAEPTKCLLISYQALEQTLRIDPALAFYLLEHLSLRVRNLVDRVAQISAQSVQARLAMYISERADRLPDRTAGSPMSLGMTQGELAEELGTVREVIVRALRSLREQGAIEPAGNGRYKVSDPAALKRAAGIAQ